MMEYERQLPIYIANVSTITPVGDSLAMIFSSIDSGISAFQETPFFNRFLVPIKGAMVPEGALVSLSEEQSRHRGRVGRLLQLALSAINPLKSVLEIHENIPLLLAGPESFSSLTRIGSAVGPEFFRLFHQYSGISVDRKNCRYIGSGRAGGLELLSYAKEYFAKGLGDMLLLGAVDTYFDPALLGALDAEGRVMAEGCNSGFFPGESAIFLLLTSNRAKSTFKAVINGPGVSCEQGHLYSDQPCLGDGITAVCQSLLSKNKAPPISLLWSTVNGEYFSIKEVGVALIRYSKYFIQSYSHIHPAEYYGDCGAASGLLLMALAAQKAEFENKSGANLVLASSDKQNCAGVVVEW